MTKRGVIKVLNGCKALLKGMIFYKICAVAQKAPSQIKNSKGGKVI
jgi:hypothetical protein